MTNGLIQAIINRKDAIRDNILTRKGTLKTSPYKLDGLQKYVWRMIRFHAGIDVTIPIMCFFDLQNYLEENGISKQEVNVCGIINDTGKSLLDELDKLVDSFCIELKLNPFKACQRWHEAGLF
jgi:hypothetical protein